MPAMIGRRPMRTPLHGLLVAAGLLLLVCFGTFRTSSEKIEDGTRDRLSVGLWFSPWFMSEKVETFRRDATGPGFRSNHSWHWKVEFLNWSWLALIGGVVALRAGLRRPEQPPEGGAASAEATRA
jgi:hypothetical protein